MALCTSESMKSPHLLLRSLLLLLLLCAAVSSHSGLLQMRVFDLKARDLHGDLASYPDAYVKIKVGQIEDKTSVRENEESPWWEEEFSYKVQEDATLKLEVHDEDRVTSDDLLGSCQRQLTKTTDQNKCEHKPITCTLKEGGELYFTYSLE